MFLVGQATVKQKHKIVEKYSRGGRRRNSGHGLAFVNKGVNPSTGMTRHRAVCMPPEELWAGLSSLAIVVVPCTNAVGAFLLIETRWAVLYRHCIVHDMAAFVQFLVPSPIMCSSIFVFRVLFCTRQAAEQCYCRSMLSLECASASLATV